MQAKARVTLRKSTEGSAIKDKAFCAHPAQYNGMCVSCGVCVDSSTSLLSTVHMKGIVVILI